MKTLLGVFLFSRAIGAEDGTADFSANAKIPQEAADHSQMMSTLHLAKPANQ